MQTGAQGLYVLPGSRIRTLGDLEGKIIGVNAPGNILYLLAASALADHGLKVSGARFAYYPLPEMAAMLKAGKVAAAVLPEPFASQAQLSMGVTLLADLDQGATRRSRSRAVPLPGSGRRCTRRRWRPSVPRSSRASRSRTPTGPPWSSPWRRSRRRSA